MKNHNRWADFLQSLMVLILFGIVGLNTANANVPFNVNDFVSIPELGGLDVQKTELTYGQWEIMSYLLPQSHQAPWAGSNCIYKKLLKVGADYPAGCISFDDAMVFVRALNAEDPKYNYRLPTEAELQALVDAAIRRLEINGNPSEELLYLHTWYNINSDGHAHESCTKAPLLELCDILGNIQEWTSGWDGSPNWGITIGGMFGTDAQYFVRGGPRGNPNRNERISYNGFRLVRTAK